MILIMLLIIIVVIKQDKFVDIFCYSENIGIIY